MVAGVDQGKGAPAIGRYDGPGELVEPISARSRHVRTGRIYRKVYELRDALVDDLSQERAIGA